MTSRTKPSPDGSIVKGLLRRVAERDTVWEGYEMSYTRTEVRQALREAKSSGRDCTALHVDARDTEITLEKWGFLPIDKDRVDARVRDWYVSQGLVVRADETDKTVETALLPRALHTSSTSAALEAAEAALTAAQAALRLAKMVGAAEAA